MSDLDAYSYASGIDTDNAAHRMALYHDSAMKVYDTFKRHGLQTFSGPPSRAMSEMAAGHIRDISLSLTTDRAEISDYFAVVPNYRITLNSEAAHKAWAEMVEKEMARTDEVQDDEPELPPAPAVLLTYHVGLELVIRDFRNYEYVACVNRGDSRNRYLMHPTGQPVPPVVPSEHARTFDVPIGMIHKVDYDPKAMAIDITAKGFCGEPVRVCVGLRSLLKRMDPVSDIFEWFDKDGNEKDALIEMYRLKDDIMEL